MSTRDRETLVELKFIVDISLSLFLSSITVEELHMKVIYLCLEMYLKGINVVYMLPLRWFVCVKAARTGLFDTLCNFSLCRLKV